MTAGTATGALRSLGPRVRRERRLMAARVPAGLTRYQASAIGADLVQRSPAYGSLIAWAKQLGRNDAARLLEQTLNEEKAADQKLTSIAEDMVNERATQQTR